MEEKILEIGNIGNYYGSLKATDGDGEQYWGVAEYSGQHWEEIPKYLYDTLLKYQDEFKKGLHL